MQRNSVRLLKTGKLAKNWPSIPKLLRGVRYTQQDIAMGFAHFV
jgi:hypothetical protein